MCASGSRRWLDGALARWLWALKHPWMRQLMWLLPALLLWKRPPCQALARGRGGRGRREGSDVDDSAAKMREGHRAPSDTQ